VQQADQRGRADQAALQSLLRLPRCQGEQAHLHRSAQDPARFDLGNPFVLTSDRCYDF
jgi:hypothetical protein